ncbi:MAG: helix-turn-helix domain-containing protein [Bacteroidales bacterium]
MNAHDLITQKDLSNLEDRIIEKISLLIQNHPKPKKWLRTSELCELLGISASSVQNLRNNKKIPHTLIEGTYFYPLEEIESLMEKNRRDINY